MCETTNKTLAQRINTSDSDQTGSYFSDRLTWNMEPSNLRFTDTGNLGIDFDWGRGEH